MIMAGADPGKNTGIAIWDCNRQEFQEVTSFCFWEAYHRILSEHEQCVDTYRQFAIYVEDPRGNKAVFDRGMGNGRKNLKIAQNVGSNKRSAGLLIDGWRRAGILVIPITPRSQKWDAKTFRAMSGWEGQTNEHGRDAAKLVLGRVPIPKQQYQRMIRTNG